MPFADICRVVACVVEVVSKRFRALGKSNSVEDAADLSGVSSALQTGSCRTAYRLTGDVVFKHNTLICKTHKVRRKLFVYSVPALLVAEIKDDVFLHLFSPFSEPYFTIYYIIYYSLCQGELNTQIIIAVDFMLIFLYNTVE